MSYFIVRSDTRKLFWLNSSFYLLDEGVNNSYHNENSEIEEQGQIFNNFKTQSAKLITNAKDEPEKSFNDDISLSKEDSNDKNIINETMHVEG